MYTRRRTCSRLMCTGPSRSSMVARSLSGISAPEGLLRRISLMTLTLFRRFSGNRTINEKRRSPSNTCVAGFPAMAVSMISRMSATLMPRRAILCRSMSTVRYDWPNTCSTFTSFTPFTVSIIAAIWSALFFRTSRSSPNNLIATSVFTPEINSSTRSWIGWLIRTEMPGIWASRRRIASTSSCLVPAVVQVLRGFNVATGSLSLASSGAVAISERPILPTIIRISGNSRTA